ncbi:MAG: type II toxin-antitoxin system RelE/ParE family toxin [Chlamydiae bacterium]|nr:MAG: type II toxin-antitoxin system RelE/ParE family toxin [Chlamydiota bacterium]
MKIIWANSAINDLKEIKAYISKDSEYYAFQVVEKIISAVETLNTFPEIGKKVTEANQQNIREIIYTPYRIIYQFEPGYLKIVTIVHSGRDLSNPKLQKWEVE